MRRSHIELAVLKLHRTHLRTLHDRITLVDLAAPGAKQRDVLRAKEMVEKEIVKLDQRTIKIRQREAKRLANEADEVQGGGVRQHAQEPDGVLR